VRTPRSASGTGLVVAAAPGLAAAFDDELTRCGVTDR
jgi:hypothetical protein